MGAPEIGNAKSKSCLFTPLQGAGCPVVDTESCAASSLDDARALISALDICVKFDEFSSFIFLVFSFFHLLD